MGAMRARCICTILWQSNGIATQCFPTLVCRVCSADTAQSNTDCLLYTGAIEAPCAICGGPMQVDLRTLTQGFSCLRCGREFIAADRLVAHSSEHTGIKAHTCTVCARTFSRVDRMREHYRKSHADMIGPDSIELKLVKPRINMPRK